MTQRYLPESLELKIHWTKEPCDSNCGNAGTANLNVVKRSKKKNFDAGPQGKERNQIRMRNMSEEEDDEDDDDGGGDGGDEDDDDDDDGGTSVPCCSEKHMTDEWDFEDDDYSQISSEGGNEFLRHTSADGGDPSGGSFRRKKSPNTYLTKNVASRQGVSKKGEHRRENSLSESESKSADADRKNLKRKLKQAITSRKMLSKRREVSRRSKKKYFDKLNSPGVRKAEKTEARKRVNGFF